MSYPFASAFRDEIAQRCAAFPRVACEAPGLKRAAVAITLVDADDGSAETAFLLTKRVPRMRAHAGQWALPGGRCDPGETLPETALRELQEELGLTLGPDNLLGVLDDYPTRSGYAITPVVAWLDDASAMTPNPDEVAFVRRIRLDHIGQEDAVEFVSHPGERTAGDPPEDGRSTRACAHGRARLPAARAGRRPHHPRRPAGAAGLRLALSAAAAAASAAISGPAGRARAWRRRSG